MNRDSRHSELVVAFGILTLLIATAWGNAIGMMVISVVVLAGLLLTTPGRSRFWRILAATVSCAVAFMVALLIHQW